MPGMGVNRRCIALLGGSFDPVHNGHVALGVYFTKLLQPDELRIIPAGMPWQKTFLYATAEDRVEMVRRAFGKQSITIAIDRQEIERQATTYTIDTLRAVRTEAGQTASLILLIGADQLQQLHTWKEWRSLFDYAHICVASRPGFRADTSFIPNEVMEEFTRRTGIIDDIRNTPSGLTYFAADLAIDIASTTIRTAFQRRESPDALIPAEVLDYIKQHNLYGN